MPYSPVDICNLALSFIGEKQIRSFDEDNIRSRLCKSSYDFYRDRLLSDFDWTFARKTAEISLLDETHPEGSLYALPEDCLNPIELVPVYTPPRQFQIEDSKILIPTAYVPTYTGETLYLRYIYYLTNSKKFSIPFCEALAVTIASIICMPITHDKDMADLLLKKVGGATVSAQQDDAEKREDYKNPQNTPENDDFNYYGDF